MSDLIKRLESVYPPRPRDLRLEAAAEIERLRAQVESLTARNARLTACAEHYADCNHWDTVGKNGYFWMYKCSLTGKDGFEVAREALKGSEK